MHDVSKEQGRCLKLNSNVAHAFLGMRAFSSFFRLSTAVARLINDVRPSQRGQKDNLGAEVLPCGGRLGRAGKTPRDTIENEHAIFAIDLAVKPVARVRCGACARAVRSFSDHGPQRLERSRSS